jgi:adenine-specific DNA-methyltransferase
MVLDHLKTAGVQQAHKEDRIAFTALTPWPGKLISAEGRYSDGEHERRAAILVGPEFGIVSRPDLVDAAREAADAGFDVVIACAFNFDARSAELDRIGRIPILKARMNPDLHMAGELKNTGAGNLFVVFGEPDIEIEPVGADQIRVKIKGVDVFKPQTGEIVSGSPDTIALWFIDTDYNEESFCSNTNGSSTTCSGSPKPSLTGSGSCRWTVRPMAVLRQLRPKPPTADADRWISASPTPSPIASLG